MTPPLNRNNNITSDITSSKVTSRMELFPTIIIVINYVF